MILGGRLHRAHQWMQVMKPEILMFVSNTPKFQTTRWHTAILSNSSSKCPQHKIPRWVKSCWLRKGDGVVPFFDRVWNTSRSRPKLEHKTCVSEQLCLFIMEKITRDIIWCSFRNFFLFLSTSFKYSCTKSLNQPIFVVVYSAKVQQVTTRVQNKTLTGPYENSRIDHTVSTQIQREIVFHSTALPRAANWNGKRLYAARKRPCSASAQLQRHIVAVVASAD